MSTQPPYRQHPDRGGLGGSGGTEPLPKGNKPNGENGPPGNHNRPPFAPWLPAALWSSRRSRFLQETVPYWRDVLRSGAGMMLILLLLTAIPAYSWALDRLPPDFPFLWVAVPLMTAAVATSPIRTFLRGADRIFLLPAEARMGAYLRRARRAAWLRQTLTAALALTALWPLYLRVAGGEAMPYAWPLLLTAAAKACALAAAAREPHLLRRSVRAAAGCARWALTAAAMYALWRYGAAAGALALAGAAALGAGLLAAGAKQRFPWERLLEDEARQQTRVYRFFSWFTDVPGLAGAIKRRSPVAGIMRMYAFSRKSSFVYLYSLTFIRREPSAIVLRLTVLAGVLLFLFPHPYAQAAIAALVLLMSGLQTASLDQYHRYSSWLSLYPLERRTEAEAIGSLLTVILTLQALVLALCLLTAGGPPLLALAGFCGGAAFAAAYGLIVAKRKPRIHG